MGTIKFLFLFFVGWDSTWQVCLQNVNSLGWVVMETLKGEFSCKKNKMCRSKFEKINLEGGKRSRPIGFRNRLSCTKSGLKKLNIINPDQTQSCNLWEIRWQNKSLNKPRQKGSWQQNNVRKDSFVNSNLCVLLSLTCLLTHWRIFTQPKTHKPETPLTDTQIYLAISYDI